MGPKLQILPLSLLNTALRYKVDSSQLGANPVFQAVFDAKVTIDSDNLISSSLTKIM